jgi:hypothetical protein
MRSFLFSFVLLLNFQTFAASPVDSARTIRSAGMGGVEIPFAIGVDAIFHNPAALVRSPGLSVQLGSLIFGVNGQEAFDLASTGSSINSTADYNQFFGKKIWFEASGQAGLALPRIGLGFLSETKTALELQNPGFPQFETYFVNDTITALSGALPIDNASAVGVTLKQIRRWGGNTTDLGLETIASANNLESIGDNFKNKGTAIGLDISYMRAIAAPTNPTLTVAISDVGSTTFSKTEGVSAPPSNTQDVNFGMGGVLDLPGLDWSYGFELRKLLNTDMQIGSKIHLGTEISLPIIDLRAGIGQGYMSYGLGMNFFLFRLDIASYTEELGIYPGQTGQNRILIGLTIDMSFDPNFRLVDNIGQRRKLKQRR